MTSTGEAYGSPVHELGLDLMAVCSKWFLVDILNSTFYVKNIAGFYFSKINLTKGFLFHVVPHGYLEFHIPRQK